MKSKYSMIRTYSAGVFYGKIKSRKGKEVELNDAIRIWYWDGACSLSQLAIEGTKSPDNCKFAIPVSRIILTEVIEIIESTKEAEKNILGVPSWKK